MRLACRQLLLVAGSEEKCAGFYLFFFVWGGGGEMLKMIVDGSYRHRPQFSRGLWGHAPRKFLNFEPSESGSEASETVSRSL